ncbi:MAG: radical SAM protein, partial [Syntrophobacteraceae bacterium]
KSRLRFKDRSKENIKRQIEGLRDFFGKDISNYNSVFLGQHDAMNSDPELLEYGARLAFEAFDFKNSNLSDPSLFIFGSVASLLRASRETFERIGGLPFKTYINVGLESGDRDTLARLGKGITVEGVEAAYGKIVALNKRYDRIEITSNFVFAPDLPPAHTESIVKLIEKHFDHRCPKGTVYFSPLLDTGQCGWRKNIKREFYKLKRKIPVPSFLYLIQRL